MYYYDRTRRSGPPVGPAWPPPSLPDPVPSYLGVLLWQDRAGDVCGPEVDAWLYLDGGRRCLALVSGDALRCDAVDAVAERVARFPVGAEGGARPSGAWLEWRCAYDLMRRVRG